MVAFPSTHNTLTSDKCKQFTDHSNEEYYIADRIFTLRDPSAQFLLYPFKLVLSLLIFEATFSLILMLKRTQFLGELITMLQIMLDELGRFFYTFGVFIAFIIIVGNMLGSDLKNG